MAVDIKGRIKLTPEFFGEKTLITSKSGGGKSYTARVMIEEGRKLGNCFVVIDPQNAYDNLEGFDYVDCSKVKSAKKLGELVARTNKNVVIQTKKLTIENQNRFMKAFLTTYRLYLPKGIHTIVIDEGHKFAPEGKNTSSKELIMGMFQENRSDGLGAWIISQRLQRLDKTIISQCDNIACGQIISFRDKDAVKNYLDDPTIVEKFSKLNKGEFYFFGFGLENPEILQVRKAETEHSGNSPSVLLNEENEIYLRESASIVKDGRKSFVKRGDAHSELNYKNQEEKDIRKMENILPTKKSLKDFAVMGVSIATGAALNAGASAIASKYIPKINIPVVSNRTLVSASTSLVMYGGYKIAEKKAAMVASPLKYATAGSIAFTGGSIVADVLNYFNVKLPIVDKILNVTTGVEAEAPKGQTEGVDVNTEFA